MSSQLLDFTPKPRPGVYSDTQQVVIEDARTRYLYLAFNPQVGGVLDIRELKCYATKIPQRFITLIARHSYPDYSLRPEELESYMAASEMDPVGFHWRPKAILPQVQDILRQYRTLKMVELQTPLKYGVQHLPMGWTMEHSVSLINEIIHFPVNGESVDELPYEEFGRHLSAEVPRRLNLAVSRECVPDPQGEKTRLPEKLKTIGLEIIEELINALDGSRAYAESEIKAAIKEIDGRGKDQQGQGAIDDTQARCFWFLGKPTPVERQMEFGREDKGSMFQDVIGTIRDGFSNLRGNAPVVEVVEDEEKKQKDAMEMARQMAKMAMEELLASGEYVKAQPKPAAPTQPNKPQSGK